MIVLVALAALGTYASDAAAQAEVHSKEINVYADGGDKGDKGPHGEPGGKGDSDKGGSDSGKGAGGAKKGVRFICQGKPPTSGPDAGGTLRPKKTTKGA